VIELKHIRYAVAAADHRSFRRAAEALNLKQSNLSRGILQMECRLGVKLFERSKSGVCPTNAGTAFLRSARHVMNDIETMVRNAKASARGEVGAIRIGIFWPVVCGFLADLLQEYTSTNPDVRPELVEAPGSNLILSLKRHDLDVAFLAGDVAADGCDVAHLWNEQIFVALPRDDVRTRKRSLSWRDLRDCHFIVSEADPGPRIHDYLVKHLANIGHGPSIEHQCVGRDNLMHLVAIGRGLTLTSEALVGARFPGVVYRAIHGHVLPFSAVWDPSNDNPALARVLRLAQSMAGDRREVRCLEDLCPL
jgi:DNA-binding transcriptional LysR family regulator